MTFIWVARGKDWGFRFLRDGGFEDPLPEFEAVLNSAELAPDELSHCRDKIALRLRDPERRADASGRPIVHDFVLYGELADRVHSVEDGLAVVWPLVADEYARVWSLPEPPPDTR